MLVSSLILIAIFSNGLSYSLQTDTAYQNSEQQGAIFQIPEQQIIFQLPEQQRVIRPPEQQEVIFQPEQQGVLFQNSQQGVLFESPKQNTDDFASDGSQIAEQDNDFTVSCTGLNRICTSKKDCVNGYVHLGKSAIYPSSIKAHQCRIHDQVCCTIAKELEGELKTFGENVKNNFNNINYQTGQTNTNYNQVAKLNKGGDEPNIFGSSIQSGLAIPTHIQVGCAAALLCVEEKFCTIDGTISPEPVVLTEKQLLRRVPMSSCKNPDNGIIGKCCRDPNYVDPWPTGNLPANYSGGFDEQGFPTFMNIVKVKLPVKTTKVPVKTPVNVEITKEIEPVLIEGNSDISPKKVYLVPPTTGRDDRGGVPNIPELKLKCGIRNKVLQQSKVEDTKTIFAEIPWQAMVLHLKERKILCSGVLLGPEDVLTAANCVDNLSPMDISIKLGEWKLGYELRHEEPLAFQIINVSSISLHPNYKGKSGNYDLAMLHLENPITFDLHINPLCLPKSKHSLQKNKLCITTGWGKSILQAHYAGAIMHAINVDILSTERCKELLLNTDFGVDIADRILCATPKEEKNNICDTDIGGPLACQNEDGSYELAGIYSQDTGCYPSNQVAMFAPLDLGWLKNIMSNITLEESHNVNNEPHISSNNYRKSTLDTDNQYLPPN